LAVITRRQERELTGPSVWKVGGGSGRGRGGRVESWACSCPASERLFSRLSTLEAHSLSNGTVPTERRRKISHTLT
jgi:hypothetical protein